MESGSFIMIRGQAICAGGGMVRVRDCESPLSQPPVSCKQVLSVNAQHRAVLKLCETVYNSQVYLYPKKIPSKPAKVKVYYYSKKGKKKGKKSKSCS